MPKEEKKQEIENDVLKAEIVERLSTVIDPELGIDIVNLGLFYEAKLFEEGLCEIRMTLTTLGCPFTDVIMENVKKAVIDLPELKEVEVKLVWYPAWDPSKMSTYAKVALNFY